MTITGPHQKGKATPRVVKLSDVLSRPGCVELIVGDYTGKLVELRMTKAESRQLAERLYEASVQS